MLLFVVREHNGMSQRTFSTTPMQRSLLCSVHFDAAAVAAVATAAAVSSLCIDTMPTMPLRVICSLLSNCEYYTVPLHTVLLIYTDTHTNRIQFTFTLTLTLV